jgi:hypothetical protein
VTAVFDVPVTVGVNCWEAPACSEALVGNKLIATFGAAEMLTLAFADFVLSAWLVAVIVTVAGLGTALGAVYIPPGEIVPNVLLPPATSFTDQFTAVLLDPLTLAVKFCVPLVKIAADEGETLTETGCGEPTVTLTVEVIQGPDEPFACTLIECWPWVMLNCWLMVFELDR